MGNRFTVDLTGIKLSEGQKKEINSAIQKAVMGELAKIDTKGNSLAPLNGYPWGPKGPILWGIIARPFNIKELKPEMLSGM